MNYQDYIKTELLILIPVLYFIGLGLKKKLSEGQVDSSYAWCYFNCFISHLDNCYRKYCKY